MMVAMELDLHQLELTYQGLRRDDAQRRAQLVASLSEQGQQSPVVVVAARGQEGRYVLIDGYQRVAALRRLGADQVSAVVLELDEVSALCLTQRMEGARRRSVLEQGWLLRELIARHEVTQGHLGLLLGHSTSWVSRRLALVRELPELAQELVRRGRLCPYGAMRHLVPLARAKRTDCVRLVEELKEAGSTVSARELGRLYVAWRSADAKERQRIVSQPLLYLRAEAAASSQSCDLPQSPELLLRRDLDSLAIIARRAGGRLEEGNGAADGRLPLVFDHVWHQTQLAFDELQQRMEGRLHAGS
jgi:ParB/RepB/Spo0J family partition protein